MLCFRFFSFFFFSSRRRHTRSLCDWSSDVCSSDLCTPLPSVPCLQHKARSKSANWPPPPSGKADRKSTRLNSSHTVISYAVFCLKKKKHTSQLQSHSDIVCCLLL